MRAERDIAGISLPFAAGVALTAWAGHLICLHPYISLTVIFSAIAVSTAFLSHPIHRSVPSAHMRTVICVCLGFCGILCGTTSEILSVSGPFTGGLAESALAMGSATGEAIDRIGFRSPDTNAIIKALIIGDRSDIPKDITRAFRDSGASHILALSGLHLGIIYSILAKVLSFIGNKSGARAARSATIILTCGLYTLATGAGPSIVRAFLFIIIGEISRLHDRYRSTGTVLLSALLIHLTIAPSDIREVGFQLSYAAMAGIAYIFPWLKGLWPDDKDEDPIGVLKYCLRPLRWIWTTASMSIACQITTAPLAWHYFGTFPVHFLLTNLIALPLTGLIIPLALLTLVLSVFGICPEMISRACEMLVTALSQALDIISAM